MNTVIHYYLLGWKFQLWRHFRDVTHHLSTFIIGIQPFYLLIKASNCVPDLSFTKNQDSKLKCFCSITGVKTLAETQAAQAPAVRWSSCEIRVVAKLKEFVWEYLRPLLGIKKIRSNSLYSHTNSYNYTITHISQDGLLTAGAWAVFGKRKKKWRETLDYLSSFSPLLECSSHFLSALQQNRAKSRLIYLLYNKEAIKFPTHYFQFSKQTLFSNILS